MSNTHPPTQGRRGFPSLVAANGRLAEERLVAPGPKPFADVGNNCLRGVFLSPVEFSLPARLSQERLSRGLLTQRTVPGSRVASLAEDPQNKNAEENRPQKTRRATKGNDFFSCFLVFFVAIANCSEPNTVNVRTFCVWVS